MKNLVRKLKEVYSNNSLALLAGVFVGVMVTNTLVSLINPVPPVPEVVVPELSQSLARSVPVTLRIPKLSLDVPFGEPLGVQTSGEIEVPEETDVVGWYQFGPTPGERGPAVVLGHVDSYLGPAVFFSLGQLDPGDQIFIDREDGTTVEFTVTQLERYPQSEFPAELVYGDIEVAGLRLITCSGVYERAVERYTHNLVVYAELVSAQPK